MNGVLLVLVGGWVREGLACGDDRFCHNKNVERRVVPFHFMYLVPDLLLGDDDVLLRVRDEHEGKPALLCFWLVCWLIDWKTHGVSTRRRSLVCTRHATIE